MTGWQPRARGAGTPHTIIHLSLSLGLNEWVHGLFYPLDSNPFLFVSSKIWPVTAFEVVLLSCGCGWAEVFVHVCGHLHTPAAPAPACINLTALSAAQLALL